MANTKISQLPIWSGTAADLRWFVMNNSGETETFKFTGYTSQLIPGGGTNSFETIGATAATTNSIVIGKNSYVANGDNQIFIGTGIQSDTTGTREKNVIIGNIRGGQKPQNSNNIIGYENTCGGGYNNNTLGLNNTSNGHSSVIGSNNTGGFIGTAIGLDNISGQQSVAIGHSNTAGGGISIAIGQGNTDTSNNRIIVIGGSNNVGSAWSLGLGYSNTIAGFNYTPESVAIGYGNNVNANTNVSGNVIIGKNLTMLNGNYSAIVGGNGHIFNNAGYSFLGGGKDNTISGGTNYSSIIGGLANINAGNYSGIFNGTLNSIKNVLTEHSTIVGSYSSTTEGDNSHIFGGVQNEISSPQAVIVGGRENYIGAGSDNSEMLGCRTSVISGSSVDTTFINTISSNSGGYDRITMISTSGRTATTNDATFVENLVIFNYSNLNYADDTAAAAGGVVLGQVYHNAGALRIRIV
jgi:hypothetical protein